MVLPSLTYSDHDMVGMFMEAHPDSRTGGMAGNGVADNRCEDTEKIGEQSRNSGDVRKGEDGALKGGAKETS